MATPMALVGLLEEQDMNSGEVLALRLEDVGSTLYTRRRFRGQVTPTSASAKAWSLVTRVLREVFHSLAHLLTCHERAGYELAALDERLQVIRGEQHGPSFWVKPL